ncbi:MAG: hypothetical protein ABIS36_05370 [Chryseolinea sp.]
MSGEKYTTSIEIGLYEIWDTVHYNISEEGPGFNMRYIEKLFRVFFSENVQGKTNSKGQA